MIQFDESGTYLATVRACLVEIGVCLDPIRVNLNCIEYGIGESGLRLREGGFEFFSFG